MSPAYSALTTIETQNIIHGTAPYLTFDNGKTKATDASSLLSIKLSDGRIFTPENNPSTPDNPIELPDGTQSLADIQMFMPVGKTSISLNELVKAPYNYGVDENRDLITATGNISLRITNVMGYWVNREDKLSICDSYYELVLKSSEGVLSTEFGFPNTTHFNASNTIYYVKPKAPPKPQVCFAQPFMEWSDRYYWEHYHFDGPISQWDNSRGFIPQNINVPSSNFPTIGSHRLHFNLALSDGVRWQDLSYDKSPAVTGIDIVIRAVEEYRNGRIPDNGANIILSGPNTFDPKDKRYFQTFNVNAPGTAIPTTFTIYSDKSKKNKIYSFTISKWIMSDELLSEPYKPDYCTNRFGSSYRLVKVNELTNANGNGWSGGLAGQSNNYQRRIGGGLYAEWGVMNRESYSGITLGYGSWTVNKNGSKHFRVNESYGDILYDEDIDSAYSGFFCITP
ncbi:hypothetical protein PT276_10150 [Orbaceae bacterium ESL0721]|nr:hypothetical protein [Orbaceae bacterium ESL0721]